MFSQPITSNACDRKKTLVKFNISTDQKLTTFVQQNLCIRPFNYGSISNYDDKKNSQNI